MNNFSSRSCIALALLLCSLQLVSADFSGQMLGNILKDLNNGGCLAFQDNTTDETTTCFKSCEKTGTDLVTMLNINDYTSIFYNPLDFFNKLQVVFLRFNSQFADCKQTEILYKIDNRFSDFAFTSGLGVNFGVSSGSALGYYLMANYITKDDFTKK